MPSSGMQVYIQIEYIEYIYDIDDDICGNFGKNKYCSDFTNENLCIDCINEYFYKKVEEEKNE